jgi:hypothetical protein
VAEDQEAGQHLQLEEQDFQTLVAEQQADLQAVILVMLVVLEQ